MNNIYDLTKQIDPETNLTIGALSGETTILDNQGRLLELEDLTYDCQDSVSVLAFDEHERLVLTEARNFRVGEWVDTCYKITLSNGHTIELTPKQSLLTSSSEWVCSEDISFGTTIKSALYDPSHKHPSKSILQVVHVHREKFDSKIPFYSFDVDGTDNLLIGSKIQNKNMISLLPAHKGI